MCEARAQIWRLLEESIPSRLKDDLHLDLLKNIPSSNMKFPLPVRLAIGSSSAAGKNAVSCLVLHPLSGDSWLVADAWSLLGGSSLLAPLLMGAVLAALTLWLAHQEFRTQLPGRRISRSID